MTSRLARTNLLTECMTIPRVCARGHGHESVRTVVFGDHRRHVSRVDSGVAATPRGTRWRERHHDRLRRHGIRPSELFRECHPDAEHRSPRWIGTSVHGVPHDGAVFTVARVALDRPQPSFGRHAWCLQLEHRISEHAWRHHAGRGDDRRGVARTRIRDAVRRQVASRADGGVHRGRSTYQLAAAKRFRPLLRVLER